MLALEATLISIGLDSFVQVPYVLTDFTEMVIEGYTQDGWFSIPHNISKLLLDEKGLYGREHDLAIPN